MVSRVISLPGGGAYPRAGFGCWKVPKDVTASVVEAAISKGYRSLDGACDYGNEVEVGAGIKSAMARGAVSREDLFVTSKLWNTNHAAQNVRLACEKTLKDLGLDYVDLYMIHFPISLKFVPFDKRYPPEWVHNPDVPEDAKLILEDVPLAETWAAMEKLVDDGLCKYIGVCNFPCALLMDLMSYARIKPAMLQVEMHPYLQQPRLLEYCSRIGLPITAYSPFGSSSYIELGMDQGLGVGVLAHPTVMSIAKKMGRTSAQVCLRWAVQRGTAVISKTSRIDRLTENISVYDFELSAEDMQALAKLDKGLRFNDPGEFCKGMGMSVPIYD